MKGITTIAALPGSGAGRASALPPEVGKRAPQMPDITTHPIWGKLVSGVGSGMVSFVGPSALARHGYRVDVKGVVTRMEPDKQPAGEKGPELFVPGTGGVVTVRNIDGAVMQDGKPAHVVVQNTVGDVASVSEVQEAIRARMHRHADRFPYDERN